MSDDEAVNAPPGFEDGTAFEPASDPAPVNGGDPPPSDIPAADSNPVDVPPANDPPIQPPAEIDEDGLPKPGQRLSTSEHALLKRAQKDRVARNEANAEVARLKGQLEGMEMERRRGPQSPAAPKTLTADEKQEATTWAHRWGLYKPTGEPDIELAAQGLAELDARSTRNAQKAVAETMQPVVQGAHAAQAQVNRGLILKAGIEVGADPTVLGQLLDAQIANDPEVVNNPAMSAGIIMLARGMSPMQARAAVAAAAPPEAAPVPNVTERPGRPNIPAKPLQGIERVIAGKRGMTADTWAKNSKTFDEGMDPSRGLVAED